MKSVGKSPECVERELGEILAARNAAIANLDDVPGVGPPDLCWIQRTAKSIFSQKKPKQQGYYHWVVGLPITSSASVAAYFARLTATAKKVGYFQGMGVGREFAIGRGIYCCYDPFSDMDIWVEIALPGGAISRALDRQGYLHDVSPELWKGVHVASFLRSELYDASVTLHCSRAFQHMTFFKTQEEEAELLLSVMELYQSHAAQRVRERIQWDQGQGTEPHHMDIICTILLEHFRRRRRWQKALQFFTELQEWFPSSAVYLARVYTELDNVQGAADLIKSALLGLEKEDHPMLVLACGYVYLEDDQAAKALQIAQSVLENDPQNRPAWLLLSRALLCQGHYAQTLRALHLMHPPLIPVDRRVLLFRVLPPNPKSITRRFTHHNPEVTELSVQFEESQKLGVLMHVVPGQILAPRNQSHGLDWGLISCTQSVMCATYDLLLDTVHTIGWEQFCEIRAKVFSLPDEEEPTPRVAQEWQPVKVDLLVLDETSAEASVVLIFTFRESSPWEKPRRKPTSVYARSMSTGTPSKAPDAETSPLEATHDAQLATKVVTKGLGQVTKKVLRRPSSASTVLHDETEQTLSPTSGTHSDICSSSSQLEEPQHKLTERQNHDTEAHLSVSPKASDSVHVRKYVEVVTTAEPMESEDEVPDAPENALPKQCPPYSLDSQRQGPPSSTGLSQDKWQVKIVSMGIKERVKYFDQMAKDKMARQSPGASLSSQFENESCVVSMRPRRSRYSIAQTIMEKLIHEIPTDPTEGAPMQVDRVDSADLEDGDLGSSESNEALPHVTDWGSFALDEASCVPRPPSRPPTRMSLFDGIGSGASDVVSNGLHRTIHDDSPCICAEWLDELILALWEDLATYTDFKSLDRKLKSKNMQTHAEQILGTIEWNTDTTDDDDFTRTPSAGPSLPESRPVDWMRRGLLCERLGKLADAEQAYRVCIFQSFNLTSLLALNRIYSTWGYCRGSILLLNKLAQFHHKKHKTQKETYLPWSFILGLSQLLESVGNKDLKAASENSHPLVIHALEDVLQWKIQSAASKRALTTE